MKINVEKSELMIEATVSDNIFSFSLNKLANGTASLSKRILDFFFSDINERKYLLNLRALRRAVESHLQENIKFEPSMLTAEALRKNAYFTQDIICPSDGCYSIHGSHPPFIIECSKHGTLVI